MTDAETTLAPGSKADPTNPAGARLPRARVRLVVTIDTECDKGPKWRVQRPLRFSNVLEGIPLRLQPVFARHGIKPTYLLSPEVIADDACAELFRALRHEADLGTHLHAEFVEPNANPDASVTKTAQSDLSPDIEFQKLKTLTNLFASRIGFQPTAFRAGRFAVRGETLASLERLGYRVDSSVTPNRWWFIERGRGVNFLGAPVQPYHPDHRDFRRPGRMRILEVPVTVLHPVWDRVPRGVSRALRPLSRAQTIAFNFLNLGDRRCRWLRPTFSDSQSLLGIARDLAGRGAQATVLCMMFHSNEATKGTSPYFDSDEGVARFLEIISDFFQGLRQSYDVHSLGLSELSPAP